MAQDIVKEEGKCTRFGATSQDPHMDRSYSNDHLLTSHAARSQTQSGQCAEW